MTSAKKPAGKLRGDDYQILGRFSLKRPGPLAIRGATLIDGTGVAPVEDSVVIVEGDRIVAAGPGTRVAIPPGARFLEARGMALLPGLWEMHAHFTQVEWGPIYLAAGVTTARDCANEFEFITAARDAIASSRGLGPRLLPAGFIDGEGPRSIGVNTATTPEQALALTRRYADAGFPQIKIYSSLKPELVATIAREAHRRGMSVTGHIPDGMDLCGAVEAGMDQINHITYVTRNLRDPGSEGSLMRSDPIDYVRMACEIDPDTDRAGQMIRFLKEHGTVIDPTLAIFELSLGAPGSRAGAGPRRGRPGAERPAQLDGRPTRHGAGRRSPLPRVPPGSGSSTRRACRSSRGRTSPSPATAFIGSWSSTRAGMTPMEAIRSATIVPARAMKLDRESGTIEAGKRADLVLVAGRPDREISDIRKVKTVIAAGRAFDCAELWKSVGFQP